MQDRYIMLKIEMVVNKILYEKNIIEKKEYGQTAKMIDKLIFKEEKD